MWFSQNCGSDIEQYFSLLHYKTPISNTFFLIHAYFSYNYDIEAVINS